MSTGRLRWITRLCEPGGFRALHGIGRVLWAVIWFVIAFFMLVCGLCGLNFVVVGVLSIFIDLGSFGPRMAGELVETTGGTVAFTIAGAIMAATKWVVRSSLTGRPIKTADFCIFLSKNFCPPT
jgi:hypothetical protein